MAPNPDSYEARYMNADAAVIQSRKPMPWWFFAILGVAALVSVGSGLASGSFAALLSLPVIAVVALVLSVLRVVVTREFVHVQLGLWGPKIALADILSIEAMDYPAMRYGGWGIRRGLDGSWAYSTPGGNGRCVRIEYRDGDRTKAVCVSTNDADEVVSAVRSLKAGGTGVRVETESLAAPEEAEVPRASEDAAKARR